MLYEMPNEVTLRVKGEVALCVPAGFARQEAHPAAFRASSEDGSAVLAAGVSEGKLGASPAEALALVPSLPQVPAGVEWGETREGEVNGIRAAMARVRLGDGAEGAVALYDCGGWSLALAAWCPKEDSDSAYELMGALESVRPARTSPSAAVSTPEDGGCGGGVAIAWS